MAKGYQDPVLQEGVVDTFGCASVRSFHLQVISLSAIMGRKLRSLDVKNAFLRAGGCDRDVILQAPVEWKPRSSDRIWKLKAPAFGLNGAPVAFVVR